MYFYRPPRHEAQDCGATAGTAIDLKLVNRIRDKLSEWRPLAQRGEGDLTRTTMELLRYWRREGRRHRMSMSFCCHGTGGFWKGLSRQSSRMT